MRKSSISELGVIHLTYSLLSIQRIDIAQLLDHITSMEPAVTSSLRLSIIRVDQDHLDLGPHQRLASSITVFTMNMKTMTSPASPVQPPVGAGIELDHLDHHPHHQLQHLLSSIIAYIMITRTMTISQSNRQDSREVGFKLGYGQRQHQ